jgi:hypothetical protein
MKQESDRLKPGTKLADVFPLTKTETVSDEPLKKLAITPRASAERGYETHSQLPLVRD